MARYDGVGTGKLRGGGVWMGRVEIGEGNKGCVGTTQYRYTPTLVSQRVQGGDIGGQTAATAHPAPPPHQV